MADDFVVRFDGINQFQEKLEAVRAKYPYKEEKILLKLGAKLKASAKSKTPTGTNKKHVKNQYKLSKVNYLKDGTNITMTNTSPLFHLLEKGHVIKNEKNGQSLGFAPGKHMVETAMIELEQTLPATVEAWLDEILGGAL